MMKFNILLLLSFFLIGACKQNVAPQEVIAAPQPVEFKFRHEVRMPKVASNSPPLLILLHGLGSNEKDLFSFAQYLDPKLLVVSARAPISLGADRFSWFGLSSSQSGWTYDIADVNMAGKDLMNYIDQISEAYNVDSSKIFIGGFSQGAILSLATGLPNSDKIAGIVCLSGRLYPELKPKLNTIKNFNDLKIFISHGTKDKVLSYQDIVSDVEYLEELGLKPTVKYYDAAHTISQDNFSDMVAWISSNLD